MNIMIKGDEKMDKKIDLRIIKTKNNLYQTLIKLMSDRPFEEIKVSDICEKALVNRSTFYSHYSDKYELLSSYIDTLKESLEKDDIEDIKSKKDKLSEKAMGLAAKVYEQVNKERAEQADTNTTEDSNDKKDSDVKDADYEEK